jgi:hypothetical protein
MSGNKRAQIVWTTNHPAFQPCPGAQEKTSKYFCLISLVIYSYLKKKLFFMQAHLLQVKQDTAAGQL